MSETQGIEPVGHEHWAGKVVVGHIAVRIVAGAVRIVVGAVHMAAGAVRKAAAVVPTGLAAGTAAVRTAAAVHTLEEVGVDSMEIGELGLPLATWDVAIADTPETWVSGQVAAVAACCIPSAPEEGMAMMVLHMDWQVAEGRVAVAGRTSPGAAEWAELQAAADAGRMD
jgi:hypothetical protein